MLLSALAIQPAGAVVPPTVDTVGTIAATNGAIGFTFSPGWENDAKPICNASPTVLKGDWMLTESRSFSQLQVRKAEFGMTVTPVATNVPTRSSHTVTFTSATTSRSGVADHPQFMMPPGLPGDIYSVQLFGKFWENAAASPTVDLTSASKLVFYVDCDTQPAVDCLTHSADVVADDNPGPVGWQNGESNWAIVAAVYVSHCFGTVYGPPIPAWTDAGSLTGDPWSMGSPIDNVGGGAPVCHFHNGGLMSPDGYYYDFNVHVQRQGTAWHGGLPFGVGISDIAFEVESDSTEIHGYKMFSGGDLDETEYALCTASLGPAEGEAYGEAIIWANSAFVGIPCTGSVRAYHIGGPTGWLVNLAGAGTCTLCTSLERGYTFEGTLVLAATGPIQGQLAAAGNSLITTPSC